jgi:hypothetical protein
MKAPSQTDYVAAYFTLYERFQQEQENAAHPGRPVDYEAKVLIVFFTVMLVRRITAFKTHHRWLENHRQEAAQLGFEQIPHRTTLSRRFKSLYPALQGFIAFLGVWSCALSPEFDSRVLIEDGSLFKAQGPVWHQSDRKAGRIPEKLRNLDLDASWRKSAYHGWVYGYSLHLSCNRAGFPKLVQVETASLSESEVLEQKKNALFAFHLEALVGDNAYFKALRVRAWASEGVLLLTPATQWKNGRYAQAYHRFIAQSAASRWLKCRRTAIEPVFDLFSKVLGTANNHKQLPVQCLEKVRTFLGLGVLAVQLAMVINNVFGLPLRQISNILTALS